MNRKIAKLISLTSIIFTLGLHSQASAGLFSAEDVQCSDDPVCKSCGPMPSYAHCTKDGVSYTKSQAAKLGYPVQFQNSTQYKDPTTGKNYNKQWMCHQGGYSEAYWECKFMQMADDFKLSPTAVCGDGKFESQYGEVCDGSDNKDPNAKSCSADCKTINARSKQEDNGGNARTPSVPKLNVDNSKPNDNRIPGGDFNAKIPTTDLNYKQPDIKANTPASDLKVAQPPLINTPATPVEDIRASKPTDKVPATKESTPNNNASGNSGGKSDVPIMISTQDGKTIVINNGDGRDAKVDTNQRGTCGNGKVDQGEECDPKVAASYYMGSGKNSCDPVVCKIVKICGNGKVDQGEECDDGNEVDGDQCSNLCKTPFCGDGKVSSEIGEVCDPNNPGSFNAANEKCDPASCKKITQDKNHNVKANLCGNGKIDRGELCDAGQHNALYPTQCNATCDGLLSALKDEERKPAEPSKRDAAPAKREEAPAAKPAEPAKRDQAPADARSGSEDAAGDKRIVINNRNEVNNNVVVRVGGEKQVEPAKREEAPVAEKRPVVDVRKAEPVQPAEEAKREEAPAAKPAEPAKREEAPAAKPAEPAKRDQAPADARSGSEDAAGDKRIVINNRNEVNNNVVVRVGGEKQVEPAKREEAPVAEKRPVVDVRKAEPVQPAEEAKREEAPAAEKRPIVEVRKAEPAQPAEPAKRAETPAADKRPIVEVRKAEPAQPAEEAKREAAPVAEKRPIVDVRKAEPAQPAEEAKREAAPVAEKRPIVEVRKAEPAQPAEEAKREETPADEARKPALRDLSDVKRVDAVAEEQKSQASEGGDQAGDRSVSKRNPEEASRYAGGAYPKVPYGEPKDGMCHNNAPKQNFVCVGYAKPTEEGACVQCFDESNNEVFRVYGEGCSTVTGLATDREQVYFTLPGEMIIANPDGEGFIASRTPMAEAGSLHKVDLGAVAMQQSNGVSLFNAKEQMNKDLLALPGIQSMAADEYGVLYMADKLILYRLDAAAIYQGTQSYLSRLGKLGEVVPTALLAHQGRVLFADSAKSEIRIVDAKTMAVTNILPIKLTSAIPENKESLVIKNMQIRYSTHEIFYVDSQGSVGSFSVEKDNAEEAIAPQLVSFIKNQPPVSSLMIAPDLCPPESPVQIRLDAGAKNRAGDKPVAGVKEGVSENGAADEVGKEVVADPAQEVGANLREKTPVPENEGGDQAKGREPAADNLPKDEAANEEVIVQRAGEALDNLDNKEAPKGGPVAGGKRAQEDVAAKEPAKSAPMGNDPLVQMPSVADMTEESLPKIDSSATPASGAPSGESANADEIETTSESACASGGGQVIQLSVSEIMQAQSGEFSDSRGNVFIKDSNGRVTALCGGEFGMRAAGGGCSLVSSEGQKINFTPWVLMIIPFLLRLSKTGEVRLWRKKN